MQFSLKTSTKFRIGCVALVLLPVFFLCVARPSVSATSLTTWPHVELPTDADYYNIGEQVSLNGIPMRMRGFVSKRDVASTVAWFKTHLGEPLMEDHVDGKTILGHPQGDHYITVQIESVDTGVNGLIGVSDMRQALTQRDQASDAKDAWARDLPSGTQIINLMSSHDDGKDSVVLLATNQQTDALNIERATRALERRGYAVERQMKLEKGSQVDDAEVDMTGQMVMFKSQNKEATLMAFHDPSGKAAIVINVTVSGP